MPEIRGVPTHKTSHQDGGSDEISVEGLAGELTAEQKSAWAQVSGKPSTFTPGAHKTSHQDGGADEISVAALAGVLTESQPSSWPQVSGKPSTFTPEPHKTSHQIGGTDEINATGLTGRCIFVDRGDPASSDFLLASFTTDWTWHDLDLSSIVPTGTVAVLVTLQIKDNAAGSSVLFRKNGNVNTKNRFYLMTQVANIDLFGDGVIFLDSNRKIEYMGTNKTWADINLTIRGWWI